jgi:hypothetical protein
VFAIGVSITGSIIAWAAKQRYGSNDDNSACNICTGWNHAHCMNFGVKFSAIILLNTVAEVLSAEFHRRATESKIVGRL